MGVCSIRASAVRPSIGTVSPPTRMVMPYPRTSCMGGVHTSRPDAPYPLTNARWPGTMTYLPGVVSVVSHRRSATVGRVCAAALEHATANAQNDTSLVGTDISMLSEIVFQFGLILVRHRITFSSNLFLVEASSR